MRGGRGGVWISSKYSFSSRTEGKDKRGRGKEREKRDDDIIAFFPGRCASAQRREKKKGKKENVERKGESNRGIEGGGTLFFSFVFRTKKWREGW